MDKKNKNIERDKKGKKMLYLLYKIRYGYVN